MPTPPEAMTGTETASAIARVSSRSYPARAPVDDLARPDDRVPPRGPPAPVRVDLERRARPRRSALGVDRHHDALTSETHGRVLDQLRSRDRRRVERDLVGAGAEQGPHVLQAPEPAADGQRQVDRLSRAPHDIEHRGAPLVGRRDVEKDELVRPLPVVRDRRLDRIPRVGEIQEPHALDDAAVLDVEARDHAPGQHRRQAATAAIAAPRSTAPV